MENELNKLKNRVYDRDKVIFKVINKYKTVKDWKKTKFKGLLRFISVVFNTSSVIILEDMLKKGLRFNPIFKSKQNIFLKEAIKSLNFKLVNLLNIYKIDFTAVDEQDKSVFDHFAYSSSYHKKSNFLDSKRILKIILKDPKIFKRSLYKGIYGVGFIILDPYLLFRMTLKKFGDLSVLWKTNKDNLFFDMYNKSRIKTLKYLIERSTELKRNKELKKIILETIFEKVFGDFKKRVWSRERKNSYITKSLMFSMAKHSFNK